MNSNHTRPRSVLLGLFIVGQLIFIIGHNLLTLAQELQKEMPAEARGAVRHLAPDWPEKTGHVWNMMEGSTQVMHRWSQVTWQLQTWSLFAPSVGKVCVFPALLLVDDEAPDGSMAPVDAPLDYEARGRLILSDNEPPDLKRFVRWGNFRLRRFENNLVVYMTPHPDETRVEMTERLQKRLKEHVVENADMLGAYLRFRLDQIAEKRPAQVILLMRRYGLKGPEHGADFVDGPYTVPVLRWQPARDENTGRPTLEIFNLATQRFEPL